MPSQPTAVNVSLKKGLVRGGVSMAPLYDWINQTAINQIEKKDIYVAYWMKRVLQSLAGW